MKKFFSLLAVLALVSMVSSVVWAAEVLPTPKTAYAEFGEGEINITVDLYSLPDTYTTNYYQNINSGSVDRIEFKIDNNFTLGSQTVYQSTATVFAKIKTNLTTMGGASSNKNLYMYTSNKTNTPTNYKVNGDGNRRTEQWGDIYYKFCNGLIRKDGKATKDAGSTASDYCDSGDYATIKMQFIKAEDADAEGKRYTKTNLPDVYHQDEWSLKGLKNLFDINDRQVSGESLVSIKNMSLIGKSGLTGGVYCGQEGANIWYSGSKDVIIFFGAEFVNVVGGDTYSTNTIQFEYSAE